MCWLESGCQGVSMMQGMEYLHQKRIVHFDLKSANLLLGYRDRRAVCKVADFGLSKQKRDTYVSNVTSQRGTLPWIAPEIIKTPHAVTEKVQRCRTSMAVFVGVWHVNRIHQGPLFPYLQVPRVFEASPALVKRQQSFMCCPCMGTHVQRGCSPRWMCTPSALSCGSCGRGRSRTRA